MYTQCPMWSLKITVIGHWNIAGALQSLCCMTWLIKVLVDHSKGCLPDIFWFDPDLLVHIWEIYFWVIFCSCDVHSDLILIQEQGHILDCVIVLFAAVNNCPQLSTLLGMHSIGAACGTLFMTHKFASMYHWILSDSCCFSASAQWGRW